MTKKTVIALAISLSFAANAETLNQENTNALDATLKLGTLLTTDATNQVIANAATQKIEQNVKFPRNLPVEISQDNLGNLSQLSEITTLKATGNLNFQVAANSLGVSHKDYVGKPVLNIDSVNTGDTIGSTQIGSLDLGEKGKLIQNVSGVNVNVEKTLTGDTPLTSDVKLEDKGVNYAGLHITNADVSAEGTLANIASDAKLTEKLTLAPETGYNSTVEMKQSGYLPTTASTTIGSLKGLDNLTLVNQAGVNSIDKTIEGGGLISDHRTQISEGTVEGFLMVQTANLGEEATIANQASVNTDITKISGDSLNGKFVSSQKALADASVTTVLLDIDAGKGTSIASKLTGNVKTTAVDVKKLEAPVYQTAYQTATGDYNNDVHGNVNVNGKGNFAVVTLVNNVDHTVNVENPSSGAVLTASYQSVYSDEISTTVDMDSLSLGDEGAASVNQFANRSNIEINGNGSTLFPALRQVNGADLSKVDVNIANADMQTLSVANIGNVANITLTGPALTDVYTDRLIQTNNAVMTSNVEIGSLTTQGFTNSVIGNSINVSIAPTPTPKP